MGQHHSHVAEEACDLYYTQLEEFEEDFIADQAELLQIHEEQTLQQKSQQEQWPKAGLAGSRLASMLTPIPTTTTSSPHASFDMVMPGAEWSKGRRHGIRSQTPEHLNVSRTSSTMNDSTSLHPHNNSLASPNTTSRDSMSTSLQAHLQHQQLKQRHHLRDGFTHGQQCYPPHHSITAHAGTNDHVVHITTPQQDLQEHLPHQPNYSSNTHCQLPYGEKHPSTTSHIHTQSMSHNNEPRCTGDTSPFHHQKHHHLSIDRREWKARRQSRSNIRRKSRQASALRTNHTRQDIKPIPSTLHHPIGNSSTSRHRSLPSDSTLTSIMEDSTTLPPPTS